MNTGRWVTGSLVAAVIAVFFVLQQLFGAVFDYIRWPTYEEWPLNLPTLVSLVIAVGLFFVLRKQKKVSTFLSEVVIELSKVTWPVRKETLLSAVVVIVMVGIASVILSLFDVMWGSMTQKLMNL